MSARFFLTAGVCFSEVSCKKTRRPSLARSRLDCKDDSALDLVATSVGFASEEKKAVLLLQLSGR